MFVLRSDRVNSHDSRTYRLVVAVREGVTREGGGGGATNLFARILRFESAEGGEEVNRGEWVGGGWGKG